MEGGDVTPAERIAGAVTYTAGGGAVVSGMTANEVAAIVGASVAVLSFAVNVWFKAQHLRLAKARADSLDSID